MPVTIYHNPRCSKSRQTLKLLEDRGLELEIVEYLKTPPTAAEMRGVLQRLGLSPRQLMRTKEAAFKESGATDPGLDDDALIEIMVANPILIERPIVINGDRAAIGRPPERVLDIV